MKSIEAFAPATIANINVGYDVLGLSLSNIGDEVHLTFNGTEQNKIIEIINGGSIPTNVDKNCCSVVIRKMQEQLGQYKGVDITIVKGFESGSGLGSSSASSAAAAYAYNALLDSPLTDKELVFFAAEGERIACGSTHLDNVAPSILGGIILINGTNTNDLIQLPVPDNLFAISLFPNIQLNTSDSRKILKDNIPLITASKQVALMGAFVSSLYEQNLELMSSSLKDLMIEPVRRLLIPMFDEMKIAAMETKALAFGISGSGPSVFAITEGKEIAKQVLKALETVFEHEAIKTKSYINPISKSSGARILK